MFKFVSPRASDCFVFKVFGRVWKCRHSKHHKRNLAGRNKILVENGETSQKFTVAVEGNIGCGKTTLLQYFAKFPEAHVLQEPVETWRNVDGHNLLGLMYHDPQTWGFTFQTYVQLTMVQQHLKRHTANTRVKLMERSIYSAKYCFVENLYKSERISHPNYVVLSKWFDFLISCSGMDVDLIVYLKTKPEILFDRIRERSRKEEKAIPLDYLKDLHQLHENWLIHHRPFKSHCPVLVLDANCDLDDMTALFKCHKDLILFTNAVEQASVSRSILQ